MSGAASFFAMGGYAVFVWPSYILTLVVLALLAIASFRAQRKRSARLKDLQAVSPHRQRRAAAEAAPRQEIHDGV